MMFFSDLGSWCLPLVWLDVMRQRLDEVRVLSDTSSVRHFVPTCLSSRDSVGCGE